MDAKLQLPIALSGLIDAWSGPQIKLPTVVRWKKYVRCGTRRQDTLQHSFSIVLFAIWLFPRLRRYVQFDEYFVLRALALHDIGEGEIHKDTLYLDKTYAGDDTEASAFLSRYGKEFGVEAVEAYLLQFSGNAIHLPTHTVTLEPIATKFLLERYIFQAVERFDYLLYAFEQYLKHRKGGVKVLVHVLRNQWTPLEELATKVPGLTEVLWMHELSAWRTVFLGRYEGRWIEQKNER